ncbi:MAG TPA: xanthine dehydrogenase family protein subunit M [Thermaerobacter sp.]
MKPAPFAYHRAHDLEDALRLLAEYGDEAKLLAGGQSLVPLLNLRLARPAHLIDIGGLIELAYVRRDGDLLRIGALTRQSMLQESQLFKESCPLGAEAIPYIGHQAIRNRGTVGGSLAHADPAAEWPLVLSTLGGSVVVANAHGQRSVPAGEFFVTYLTTALMPDEMICEIQLPVLPAHYGWSFQEVARRHGDFALVAAAALVGLDAEERMTFVRLAWGGVGPVPEVADGVEDELLGQQPRPELLRRVAQDVAARLNPDSDLHATAEYRRSVAGVLGYRALLTAVERARARTGRPVGDVPPVHGRGRP